ncbi:MAG TPA: hypothetical protein PKD17_03140, partial [Cellvibrionaceae bacterium]|nr:hypothetical protein [Cellvibrionaceae bacterium]
GHWQARLKYFFYRCRQREVARRLLSFLPFDIPSGISGCCFYTHALETSPMYALGKQIISPAQL